MTITLGAKRLLIALCVLLVNSAYLAAFASPTLFYFFNVVLHMVLGVTLAVAFGLRMIRMRPGAVVMIASAFLAVGALAGAAIMIVGVSGRWRPLLPIHIW
jgi:hypothetical protein